MTNIVFSLLSNFWFIFLILFLIIFLRSPVGKGMIGELLVRLSARFLLDRDKYKMLNDITLPTKDGTTQIDHIIVSEYGIFVIETKNYKGWIFGSENQASWTQKIFDKTYKFQNPLRQNYKHIKTVQNLLEIDADKIFSVIVFTGDSEFKTDMPENVIHGIKYINYIKSKRKKIIPKYKVARYISKIESTQLKPSLKTKREHIKHVKNIKNKS